MLGKLKAVEGTIEDKMVGWHHQLDRYEFEQAPVVGEGQLVTDSMGSQSQTHLSG